MSGSGFRIQPYSPMVMVHPGVDALIQTDNLRDGFEDKLFQMLDSDKMKQIVSPVVCSATSYVLDPIVLDKGRQQAAAALIDI